MSEERTTYRLVTRPDFDGLVSAVLLRHVALVDRFDFVQPRDVEEARIALGPDDVTSNLPFVPAVHLAFDHHLSERLRLTETPGNCIIDAAAPSAARVIWEHYGADAFPGHWDEMMQAVDKADTAQFTEEDVLHPGGWVLLGFLIDERSALEREGRFRVPMSTLFRDLIEYCSKHGIDEMFALPDIRERVIHYFAGEKAFREQIERCAQVRDPVVVVDLRGESDVQPGNRFLIYALYPRCAYSVHLLVQDAGRVLVAVGRSIFNHSGNLNVAQLMLRFGGGGHHNAGTCEVEAERVDEVVAAVLAET